MKDICNEVKEKIGLIEGTYDIIRVVDPINKNSIVVESDEIKYVEGTCYDFWKRGLACKNCISMRAYNEKDTVIKMEYLNNEIFMITATPILIEGRTYILETLKNISQNQELIKNNCENLIIQGIINEVNDEFIFDKVSGVYNRKYLDERLPVDINICNINGDPLSIIKITIDYLKSIEYRYGKDIEDKVIREVIKIAEELIANNSGWIGRYNSDTFFMVLKKIDDVNIKGILGKAKELFSHFIFRDKDISTEITVNLESYCVSKNKEKNIENILKEMQEQFYGENAENKELENNILQNDHEKMSKLIFEIKELQKVLNEVCLNMEEVNYGRTLEISQYLDELIVKYMKSVIQQKK
jgi:diguanylate cyclase (GGDEF)-like protein